jgi:hypothetical protein
MTRGRPRYDDKECAVHVNADDGNSSSNYSISINNAEPGIWFCVRCYHAKSTTSGVRPTATTAAQHGAKPFVAPSYWTRRVRGASLASGPLLVGGSRSVQKGDRVVAGCGPTPTAVAWSFASTPWSTCQGTGHEVRVFPAVENNVFKTSG